MKQEEQPLVRTIVAARAREAFEVELRFSDGAGADLDPDVLYAGGTREPSSPFLLDRAGDREIWIMT